MMLHLQGMLIAWAGIVISISQGAGSQAVCAPGVTRLEVSSSEHAQGLVDALNCTGGAVLDVTWNGSVVINETFIVQDGTSLNITGSSGSTISDAAVIDAEGTTAIFYVKDFSTLNLDNVVIQGGANTTGGAISLSYPNGGVVNVFDCTFRNNTAFNGGVFYAEGNSTVSISGATTFTGNSATNYGGAIYAEGDCTVTIIGATTFSRNLATYGGAISADAGSIVTISGATTFTDNSASYGGAIDAYLGSIVTISGATTFTGNSATYYGGGISAEANSTVIISGATTVARNWAAYGGAIHAEADSDVTIIGATTTTGNSATYYGGDIDPEVNSTVAISGGTTFTGNSATYGGS